VGYETNCHESYHVLKITGGRKASYRYRGSDTPNIPSEKYKNDGYTKEAFVLECVYFVFDGNQFGPILKSFIIRKFEGEKDIQSLPVYPLTLDSNHVNLRKQLLKRGERYAELCDSQRTQHMQYKGLTLGNQPEQVRAQRTSNIAPMLQLTFITID
jgi:uncharacterized protein DUF7025